MNEDAVRIDSSSSSRVVAPSYSPAMVLSATRMGSTSGMPSLQRLTARTILLTSIGSCAPERLVTRMGLRGAGGELKFSAGCMTRAGEGAGVAEERAWEAWRFIAMFPLSVNARETPAAARTRATPLRALRRPPLPRATRSRRRRSNGCRARDAHALRSLLPRELHSRTAPLYGADRGRSSDFRAWP